MNKTIIYIFAMFSLVQITAVKAQESKQNKKFDLEAFESKKGAFITAEMGLTPEEAAEFIPLCNELQRKKFECGKGCREKYKELRKLEREDAKISDKIYLEAINCGLESRIKEAELEKEYYTKFLRILSPAKLYKYRDAEMKFGKMFMKEQKK